VRLFHATSDQAAESILRGGFDLNVARSSDPGDFGWAIYLTGNLSRARALGTAIIEVEAAFRNPLRFATTDEAYKWLEEEAWPTTGNTVRGPDRIGASRAVAQFVQSMGHDAIIVERARAPGGTPYEVAAFDAGAVKPIALRTEQTYHEFDIASIGEPLLQALQQSDALRYGVEGLLQEIIAFVRAAGGREQFSLSFLTALVAWVGRQLGMPLGQVQAMTVKIPDVVKREGLVHEAIEVRKLTGAEGYEIGSYSSPARAEWGVFKDDELRARIFNVVGGSGFWSAESIDGSWSKTGLADRQRAIEVATSMIGESLIHEDAHSFCRALRRDVMEKVKLVTTPAERKAAHGYRSGGGAGSYAEFRGPNDFYWHGRADCIAEAESEGWMAWLEKFHPEMMESVKHEQDDSAVREILLDLAQRRADFTAKEAASVLKLKGHEMTPREVSTVLQRMVRAGELRGGQGGKVSWRSGSSATGYSTTAKYWRAENVIHEAQQHPDHEAMVQVVLSELKLGKGGGFFPLLKQRFPDARFEDIEAAIEDAKDRYAFSFGESMEQDYSEIDNAIEMLLDGEASIDEVVGLLATPFKGTGIEKGVEKATAAPGAAAKAAKKVGKGVAKAAKKVGKAVIKKFKGCPKGTERNATTGACEPIKCPDGQALDKETGQCVSKRKKDEPEGPEQAKTDAEPERDPDAPEPEKDVEKTCPEGQKLDPETGGCVPIKAIAEPEPEEEPEQEPERPAPECPEGMKWNKDTGHCEPEEEPEEEPEPEEPAPELEPEPEPEEPPQPGGTEPEPGKRCPKGQRRNKETGECEPAEAAERERATMAWIDGELSRLGLRDEVVFRLGRE